MSRSLLLRVNRLPRCTRRRVKAQARDVQAWCRHSARAAPSLPSNHLSLVPADSDDPRLFFPHFIRSRSLRL